MELVDLQSLAVADNEGTAVKVKSDMCATVI
jgi:hypothetical protein